MNGSFTVDGHAEGTAYGPGLFGRQAERKVLDQVVASARAGRGRALVIRGAAGVGKTALLDYLMTRADGCRTARAAGVESERECAFAALHRLCEAFQDRLECLSDPQRDALATAFGQRSVGSPNRFLVGLATLSLLSEPVVGQQPLVCVIDDAQWLDTASAQALGFAARRLADRPVALVFAVRQPGTDQDLDGLPEFVVPGLLEEDARALLAASLIGPVDPGVRDRMLAEAEGNPRQLLQMASLQTPEELAGGFGVPAAVAASALETEALRRHMDTLPPAARLLLLIAAAEPAGNPVLVWRAAGCLGLKTAAEASSAVASIVEVGAHVRFRHPLARSVVYWAASPAERQNVHRALAAVIDPEADPHRRVWHLAYSSSAPDEDVAAAIEHSADSIRSRGGLSAGAVFHEHAVTRTPEAGRRAKRTLVAARVKHLAGAPDSALRLLALAQAGPLDGLGCAQASLLRAQVTMYRNFGRDASRRLLQAASLLETLDPGLARKGYRDALHMALAAGGLAGRDNLLEVATAVRTARAVAGQQSPADLAEGLAVLVTEGFAAGAPVSRRALAAISDQADRVPVDFGWLLLGCRLARNLWDHGTWSRLSSRLIEEARCAGALRVLPAAMHDGAITRVLAGDFAAAATMARQAEAIAQTIGVPVGPYGSLAVAAWSGAQAELERLITVATPRMLARDEGQWLTAVGWARALVSNGLGRYGQTLAAVKEGAADGIGLGFAAWSMAELIEAAALLGSSGCAGDALGRLSEIAKASATDWALGLLARSQALMSDDATAEEQYRKAISLLDQAGMQAELARAHLLYGEWLRRQKRRLDARNELRAAHQMLTEMGATGFAERARRELAAVGGTVCQRGPESRQALTDQEGQIARLAADGLTNPEIGVKLYLSARTVEWHLRKVYVKLGVSSRRELRDTLPDFQRLPTLTAR